MTFRPSGILGAFVLAAAVPLMLAACGKKGSLEPVEGATRHERVYPDPDTVNPGQDDEASR